VPKIDEALAALAAIQAGATPRDFESQTLEFKEQGRSEGDTLKVIADAALCFANASGGVVVVGVADQKGGTAALLGALAVAGCDRATGPKSTPSPTPATAMQRASGYTPGVAQWGQFLNCWRAEAEALAGRPEREGWQSVLHAGRVRADAADPMVDAALAQAEKALGVSLPNSYKDFARAYEPDGAASAPGSLASAVQMFPIQAVMRLKDFDPEAVQLAAKYPHDPADVEYFVYGTDQDDVKIRTKYIGQAIVVGKFGHSVYESIVLFPSVRTADGEMEAALLQHTGQFRAPSFAELMRQLSFHETKGWVDMPPYPQSLIKNTCADRLPLGGVWWR